MKLIRLEGSVFDFDEIARIEDPRTNTGMVPPPRGAKINVYLRNGDILYFEGLDADRLREVISTMPSTYE